MNPKCQTRPEFDTFSAKSADLTGLKMRRITRAVSLPDASRASDRKDSTPRHGRLLHPSSWAERDGRGRAAENFFQGGSPKQSTPFPRQDLLTARNRFTPNFRG